MRYRSFIFFVLSIVMIGNIKAQSLNKQEAVELIKRVLPKHYGQFDVVEIPADNGKDVFEIESRNGKIILRGNNPVSVASALNWYLKYTCHKQMSWCGDNMDLPKTLPLVSQKIRKQTPYEYRSYLNYCTFNYTSTWWDWKRWEREIDWMAMHGINNPLAITGQEAVWQNTLRQYGMSDDEIRSFLVGPAYQAWQWMTNIESICGPLPQHWIDRSVVLGKKILERERALGMTPILQGFTGYVPIALKEKQPNANILKKPVWFAVGNGTAQLDPLDPLFEKMTKTFMEEQAKLFGTNHLYAADPFHEGQPPVKGDEYLAAVGKKIYETTKAVDSKAIIVMQTWSMRKPIVQAIPSDKIIMLDLNSKKWKGSEAFWGRPWVAGIIHNFGGNTAMGGNLKEMIERFPHLLNSKDSTKNYKGIGMFPEAIGHNPIIFDAASEMAWYNQSPDANSWVNDYIKARYGVEDSNVTNAWQILLKTSYGQKDAEPFMESSICARPALKVNGASPNGALNKKENYPFEKLWQAAELLQAASPSLKATDTYKYDLVDLMRQCMADLAIPMQQKMAKVYLENNAEEFTKSSRQFLDLMDDFDKLLGTRNEFLLGKWIADARAIGVISEEKNLYEKNARGLLTTWGPYADDALIYDYTARQWNGLVKTFYRPRWDKFITMLEGELKKPIDSRYKEVDIDNRFKRPKNTANSFYKMISKWEADWVETPAALTATVASKNEIATVKSLFNKWKPVANQMYLSK